MKISIVIATNRDPSAFVQKTINSVLPCPHELEFIVGCPFEININNVKQIKDSGDGPVEAFNMGFQQATGDVIQLLADDVVASNNWWQLAEKIINEKAIGTLGYRHVGSYISPHFPMISRNFLKTDFNDYIFNPAYYYMQADNDLGVYCHHMQIPIICGQSVGHHTVSNNQHPKIPYYSKMDAGVINLLWGEQSIQNPNEDYTVSDVRILGERIRHPACIDRMNKIANR